MESPTFYFNNPSISLSKPWKLENSQFQKFHNFNGGLGGLQLLNYMEILIGMKGLKIACGCIKVIYYFFGGIYLHFFNLEIIISTHKKDFCEKMALLCLILKKKRVKFLDFYNMF